MGILKFSFTCPQFGVWAQSPPSDVLISPRFPGECAFDVAEQRLDGVPVPPDGRADRRGLGGLRRPLALDQGGRRRGIWEQAGQTSSGRMKASTDTRTCWVL